MTPEDERLIWMLSRRCIRLKKALERISADTVLTMPLTKDPLLVLRDKMTSYRKIARDAVSEDADFAAGKGRQEIQTLESLEAIRAKFEE